MKRLSTEKRNQLILVIMGTIGLISAVYFLLIGPQKDQNNSLKAKTVSEQDRLVKMKGTMKIGNNTSTSTVDNTAVLARAEEDIASGDLFAWTYDMMRRFKAGYRIDIPSIGQPTQSDVDLIPDFPYKQIKFSLIGTGYFHDIGKFASDFENKFPHMRIVNLSLEPGVGADLPEKIAFRMEIIALVKPNA